MKKNIFVFLILLLCNALSAQDIIYKQNGDQIKAKVTEISSETIKYKEFDFMDGPVRVLNVKDVFMIIYQNGKREVFAGADKNNQKPVVKTETNAPANVTKPAAQKETPAQTNVTKPAAQKEPLPQTNVTKPAVQIETPPQPNTSKPIAQNETTTKTKNDPSGIGGFWITNSDKVFYVPAVFEIVMTEEDFKLCNPDDSNIWALFKITTYPEYQCSMVNGKKMEPYQGSKITVKDPDNLNLQKINTKDILTMTRTKYYTVNDAGELYVNHKKTAIIKKTASGSLMSTTVAEFTIYDVNGKPYLLSEGTNSKYLFLDDNKSYIPSQTNAQINGNYGIAHFIAGEKIFTPEGFNNNYRAEFIKKYRGYDAMASTTNSSGSSKRDRTARVQVDRTNIYQGNEIIGNVTYKGDMSALWGCEVYDMNRKLISRMTFSAKSQYNMVHVVIYLGNNSSPEKTYETMWSTMLLDEAVKWLVDKNHL